MYTEFQNVSQLLPGPISTVFENYVEEMMLLLSVYAEGLTVDSLTSLRSPRVFHWAVLTTLELKTKNP